LKVDCPHVKAVPSTVICNRLLLWRLINTGSKHSEALLSTIE